MNDKSSIFLFLLMCATISGQDDPDFSFLKHKSDNNCVTFTITYKKFENRTPLELDIDIAYDSPMPVILFVHSWSGNKDQLKAFSQRLAKLGVAGVRVDYRRLSDGYSLEEAYSDITDALLWIRENGGEYGFDLSRVGVAGASAGGLLGALIALEHHDCTVFIGFNGGYDLFDRGSSRWPPAQYFENLFGTPNPRPELLQKWSPIHRITRDHQPYALLLHGTSDETIEFLVAERFASRLNLMGGDAQLVSFEGKRHGFFHSTEPSFERVFDYVWQHIKTHLVGDTEQH